MKIVARRTLWGQLWPVALGAVAVALGIAMPIFLQGPLWANALLGIWFVAGGTAFITVGIFTWQPKGVALAFDDDGIHWSKRVVPWKDIERAEVVSWADEYGDQLEAVVVTLREDSVTPMGPRYAECLSMELRKKFGRTFAAKLIVLNDESWIWMPTEVVQEIRERTASS